MTLGYLIRRLGWNKPSNQRQAITNVVNTTLDETVGILEQRIAERFEEVDNQFREIANQHRELAEHVDGVVALVTSVVEDTDKAGTDVSHLTDRVSRLAYMASETKDLLNKTIDSIDWDDDPQPSSLPLVYDTVAPVPVEEFQRPYIPPVPPQAPPLPQQPVPQAPVAPVVPQAPPRLPQPREIEPPLDMVPLVGPRSEADPIITDLRAVPFQDHPDADVDIHSLPPSAEYEEFGSPGSGRRSSRTSGLRQRFR